MDRGRRRAVRRNQIGVAEISAQRHQDSQKNQFLRLVGSQLHDDGPAASLTNVSSFTLTFSVWPPCSGEAVMLSIIKKRCDLSTRLRNLSRLAGAPSYPAVIDIISSVSLPSIELSSIVC